MSWILRLSIKYKVFAIAAIGILAFVAYLSVNFAFTSDTNARLTQMRKVEFPILQELKEMAVDLVNMQESYATAFSNGDVDTLGMAQESAKAIRLAMQGMAKANPELEADVQRLLASFDEYTSAADGLAKSTMTASIGGDEGASDASPQDVIMLRRSFDQQQQEFQAVVYKHFGLRLDGVRAQAEKSWRIGLVVGASMIVMVLLLSFIVVRSTIIRPLNRAVTAADSIAQGEWEVDLDTRSTDEVGRMLSSLSAMRDSLKSRFDEDRRKERIKTLFNDLNDRMRGDQTMDELASNIINFLVPSLHGQVGLFYLFNEEKGELALLASYAFVRRRNLNNVFKLGESLVGQAALERKPILLTHVPDDYVQISSGAGEHSPRNILVMPVIHENSLCAVVELGSFEPYSDNDMEFLNMSVESIAIAINSAISRNKLGVMLQQTQEQAELMRRQQSELQQINEDLEAQAIALSASEMKLQQQQEDLRKANEELEEQAQALRASEESLQAQQEELRVINEELEAQAQLLAQQKQEMFEKNEQLEHSSEILEEKNRQLELSSKYKSEFLSTMSHELRTPLNSILILSNSMSENKNGNLSEKQVEHCQVIHSAGSDLLALINDILDLAKVEEGKMQLVIEALGMSDLAAHMRRSFEHVANHRGLSFTVIEEPELPNLLFTDRQRLEQVLRNLFSNAFKFTHQGGVTLNMRRATANDRMRRRDVDYRDMLAFEVIDTGIGIPKDKQELIFEAFQQADGTTSRKYGGTGLGLTITRELSNLLGGEVQVTSLGESQGSCFTVFLPIGNASSLEPGSYPEAEMHALMAVQQSAGQNPLPPIEHTLLVIEDDENFSMVLHELASQFGLNAVMMPDGESGLAYALEHRPAAIILDVGLPGMDGWQVMEELKKSPVTADIPVHFLSGANEKQRGLRLGAIDFLTKPVDLEQLRNAFNTIERAISKDVRRLLVVEDNQIQHDAISKLFGEHDIDITVITSGQEALDHLKRESFDCMILDLSLPDMDGFTLLSTIREGKDYHKVPVIVYTARDLGREEEAKLRRYADRIILKTDKSSERLLNEVSLFLHWLESHSEQPARTEEPVLHRDDVFMSKKVLLVDDDMRNIYALSASLEDLGFEVLVANNGRESLEQLDLHPEVDLVLMDIMMPEMDGYEAMRHIRAKPEFANLPILALTAKAMRDDKAKCIEAGANDYIAKPLDMEKLQSLMRVWLQK